MTLGILGLQKDEHAVVVQRVYRDPAHSAGRGLGVGGQDQAFPVPNRLSGERAGRAVGEGRVEDERSGHLPRPKDARLEILARLDRHLQSGRVAGELPGPIRRLSPEPSGPSPPDLPDPRHEPTSGAYALSASWSARRLGATFPCRRQPAL